MYVNETQLKLENSLWESIKRCLTELLTVGNQFLRSLVLSQHLTTLMKETQKSQYESHNTSLGFYVLTKAHGVSQYDRQREFHNKAYLEGLPR